MGLSDELLDHRTRLRAVRARVAAIVEREGAVGGFLVDEEGALFGAAGNVELPLPHPAAALRGEGGDSLLGALVGESAGSEPSSCYVVVPVSERALLAIVYPAPRDDSDEHKARRRLRREAKKLRPILEGRELPPIGSL